MAREHDRRRRQGRQVHGRHDDVHGADAARATTSGASSTRATPRFIGGPPSTAATSTATATRPARAGLFGVIRDGDRVWVDTDQDLSFADETGIGPYGKNHQVGTFGTDNPATPVREIVPFVVQVAHEDVGTPPVQKTFVNIGIVAGFHGSHVAGHRSPATGCSAAR